MSENAKWYVIHTYSGYENAVKTSIEKFVNGRGMEDVYKRQQLGGQAVQMRTGAHLTGWMGTGQGGVALVGGI